MDRAAFLRSLTILRPLPPAVWDASCDGNNDDEEDPYSGSTITPPTPSKNNSLMLFEESLFVVSIEPKISCSDKISDISTTTTGSRKRGRGDNEIDGSTAVGPAFFQHDYSITNKSKMNDKATNNADKEADGAATAAGVPDAMDVDQENIQQDERETDLKLHINSDPSLCTFEAVIVKKLSLFALGDNEPVQNGVFDTPTRHRQATAAGLDTEVESALLFRFGNHFVFHVDESAILEVKYEPGCHHEGVSGKDTPNANKDGDERNSPPSKRQRNEGDKSSHTDKALFAKAKKTPPSLIISFKSCSLRVFSLEDSSGGPNSTADTTRPSSRIWGTLAKTSETVEDRLMKARSVLLQQFDIENKGRKHYQQHDVVPSSWKMAPPGSGLAFHSWPELSSSFHSNTLKYRTREDWSCCLGKKKTIECPSAVSSPQKSSTPSKSGSSSTHFEQGQKEQAPTKNGSSQSHSADISKHDNDEKNDDFNQSSELTHESRQNEEEKDDPQLKESQSLLFDDPGMEGKDSGVKTNDRGTENGKQDNQSDTKQRGGNEKKTEEDGIDTQHENTNQQPWKDGIFNKYHIFETSSIHLEKSMDHVVVSSQCQRDGSSMTHLTSCAESLSNSYLTANEFMNASQQCEDDIENATSEMESVLEKMFPARGKKANAVSSGQSEDCQRKIEELMSSRKEAVAAKLALLMTPNR